MGIAKFNDSAHSMISTLRNTYYIPIEDKHTSDGTCDYYMTPEEIVRYNNPELRKLQKAEMEVFVNERRLERRCKGLLKFINHLNNSPRMWRYHEQFESHLNAIWEELNVLLKRKDA